MRGILQITNPWPTFGGVVVLSAALVLALDEVDLRRQQVAVHQGEAMVAIYENVDRVGGKVETIDIGPDGMHMVQVRINGELRPFVATPGGTMVFEVVAPGDAKTRASHRTFRALLPSD